MPGADEAGSAAPPPVPGAGADETGPPTGGDHPQIPGDDRLASRMRRADRYYNEHLRKQRDWYSTKASSYKKWGQRLSFIVIAAGALTTFLQILQAMPGWMVGASIATGALGVIVAVAEGVKRIGKFEETWLGYRKASEQMKREHRLYINAAGDYALDDEEAAYRLFVENVEAIVAEEQQIYWQTRTGGGARTVEAGDAAKSSGAGG